VGFISIVTKDQITMSNIVASPAGGKESRRSGATFRRQVRHLHCFGPRPTGEFIPEVLTAYSQASDVASERLARFAELDQDVVRWLGAGDWIEPAAVVRPVAGGRP
jgi:hypothetical protein